MSSFYKKYCVYQIYLKLYLSIYLLCVLDPIEQTKLKGFVSGLTIKILCYSKERIGRVVGWVEGVLTNDAKVLTKILLLWFGRAPIAFLIRKMFAHNSEGKHHGDTSKFILLSGEGLQPFTFNCCKLWAWAKCLKEPLSRLL